MNSSLDLPGSRKIIERIVKEYEKALDEGNGRKALDAKLKLDRWSLPLARWYLDRTKGDENEMVHSEQ